MGTTAYNLGTKLVYRDVPLLVTGITGDDGDTRELTSQSGGMWTRTVAQLDAEPAPLPRVA